VSTRSTATPDEDFVEKRINNEIRRLCETTRYATIVAKRTKTHPKGGNSTRSMINFIFDLILEYSMIGLASNWKDNSLKVQQEGV
jgi:hypothetical protein